MPHGQHSDLLRATARDSQLAAVADIQVAFYWTSHGITQGPRYPIAQRFIRESISPSHEELAALTRAIVWVRQLLE